MDPYPRGCPLGATRGVRGPGGGRSQHGAQELRGADALRRRGPRCSQVGKPTAHTQPTILAYPFYQTRLRTPHTKSFIIDEPSLTLPLMTRLLEELKKKQATLNKDKPHAEVIKIVPPASQPPPPKRR